MNLIKDSWLPVVRKNGVREKIAIHQLLDNYTINPVMDLEAPRPDFRNALYQLLIGIVQVSAMPEKERNWKKLFSEPYSSEDFSKRVLKYEECFEIDSEGPAFMQDFDMPEGYKKETLKNLFINLPANELYTPSNESFKKEEPFCLDVHWAAIALYTLQTFAPGGGRGHKAGIRGGGPLTTLVVPEEKSSLWCKLWFNVISEEHLPILSGEISLNSNPDIFPWMKLTTGKEVYPSQCNPMQMYFGMPRRIRFEYGGPAICDISGNYSKKTVTGYKTRHSGNDYKGLWTHPLTPYHFPNKEGDLLSLKPKIGGIGYKHWLSIAFGSDNIRRSINIKLLDESVRKDIVKEVGIQAWSCGYAMNKMKSECWYESKMPLYSIDGNERKDAANFVSVLIQQAQEISSSLCYAIKSSWASQPKDLSGDMSFLYTAFWQNTEPSFYTILKELIDNLENIVTRNRLVDEWGRILRKEVETLFDANALAQQEDVLHMKRVVKARKGLNAGISKMIKKLNVLKGEEE